MDENNENKVTPEQTAPPAQTPAAEESKAPEQTAPPAPEQSADSAAPAKKTNKKKITVIACAAVAVLLAISVLVTVLGGGGGKTAPIKVMEKYFNAKSVKIETLVSDYLNGIDGGKAAEFIKLAKKIEFMSDEFEDIEDGYSEKHGYFCEAYGKNFRAVFSSDKEMEEKIDRDGLRSARNSIRDCGEELCDLAEELEGYKKTELRDLAEDLDIGLSDLKKMISCVRSVGEKLKDADVSEGYVLEMKVKITGKELDEPMINRGGTVTVVKVNGKWLSHNSVDVIRQFVGWAEDVLY